MVPKGSYEKWLCNASQCSFALACSRLSIPFTLRRAGEIWKGLKTQLHFYPYRPHQSVTLFENALQIGGIWKRCLCVQCVRRTFWKRSFRKRLRHNSRVQFFLRCCGLCVFRVKTPFSNFSGQVWTALERKLHEMSITFLISMASVTPKSFTIWKFSWTLMGSCLSTEGKLQFSANLCQIFVLIYIPLYGESHCNRLYCETRV